MSPFAEITSKDVILLTGPEFLIDRLWQKEFGEEVQNKYREVPFQLIYVLSKYGPVITHGFFLKNIQDACGEMKRNLKGELERERLGTDAANQLIGEAVRLRLITAHKADGDHRVTLYRMTEEQMEKLYRIREGAYQSYGITARQAENPTNADCGRTDDNASWCANIYTHMVMRHDEVYHENIKQLKKWQHLLSVIAFSAAI